MGENRGKIFTVHRLFGYTRLSQSIRRGRMSRELFVRESRACSFFFQRKRPNKKKRHCGIIVDCGVNKSSAETTQYKL